MSLSLMLRDLSSYGVGVREATLYNLAALIEADPAGVAAELRDLAAAPAVYAAREAARTVRHTVGESVAFEGSFTAFLACTRYGLSVKDIGLVMAAAPGETPRLRTLGDAVDTTVPVEMLLVLA